MNILSEIQNLYRNYIIRKSLGNPPRGKGKLVETYGKLNSDKIKEEAKKIMFSDSNIKQLNKICINIWDDFYDDDNIPEGEKQESYIYVDDNRIDYDKQKYYLSFFLDYINKNLNTEGVKLWLEFYESSKEYPALVNNKEFEWLLFNRWEIKIEGLTHIRLDEWMNQLGNIDIRIDDISLYIDSSS